MSGETISASDAGYMINAKGHQVPLNLVKPSDRQIDETVREIHGYANELMNQIARFRSHTYDDLGALMELLADQY